MRTMYSYVLCSCNVKRMPKFIMVQKMESGDHTTRALNKWPRLIPGLGINPEVIAETIAERQDSNL